MTAVGLNAIAGHIMHIDLTLTFLLLSGGNRDSQGLPVPSPAAVGLGLAIAVAIIAISLAASFTGGLAVKHVVPQLKSGWVSMKQIGRSPGRLALLFGGSATITLASVAAIAASLAAVKAAFVAAFSLTEEAAIVIPAVFLFRFVTLWLPIFPGWVALTYLRNSEQL